MRPSISLIITLFFISLIACQTCCSALDESYTSASPSIFNKMEREGASYFSQGQGHSLGKGRKLLMKNPIFSTKNKIDKEEATKTRVHAKPDVLDIAGMDYSPARRKSPIHN